MVNYWSQKLNQAKNKLNVKWIKSPTDHNINQYKAYKRMLNTVLKKMNRIITILSLTTIKNNLKKFWTLIKRIINRKKWSVQSGQFIVDGKITSDSGQIAEGFNKFYTNVGPSPASKIPTNSYLCPTHYI